MNRTLGPRGHFNVAAVPSPLLYQIPARPLSLREVIFFGFPGDHVEPVVRSWRRSNLRHLWRGLWRTTLAERLGLPHIYGQWAFAVVAPSGERIEYGLASMRVVTTLGAKFIVDAMKGVTSLSSMRYHALGSGGGLESVADTGLTTEISSDYSPANTRPTGTLTNGTDTNGTTLNNVFRTVATVSIASSVSIREAGIFSGASTSDTSLVLLDRGVFTTTTILEGYAVLSQYDFTVNAGS